MTQRLLILVLLVWGALPATPAAARGLDIYFVDVEGGAATLIVTPAGESLLVDTGYPREDARDAKRIAAAAREAGLKRIDHLITTHYHRDHWGGLADLAKLIPLGRFYDHGRLSELAEDQAGFPKLNEAYSTITGNKSTALKPGDHIALRWAPGSQQVSLKVLAADGRVLPASNGGDNPACGGVALQKDDPSDNARSVGFLLRLGDFRFLDLGDLTWNVEHRLVCPVNAIGEVTLYQVTHHGLNTSNNAALLGSVRPQVAVMNNGPRKGGHPEVTKALRSVEGIEAIYQVHRNIATTDDDNTGPDLIANLGPEDTCEGRMIKVSVAPDGSSYTVTNGRTGQSRTFQTRQ